MVVATRSWGELTERRIELDGGLQIDIGITRPEWAAVAPVDPGTASVVANGLVALHDPDALLTRLVDVCD